MKKSDISIGKMESETGRSKQVIESIEIRLFGRSRSIIDPAKHIELFPSVWIREQFVCLVYSDKLALRLWVPVLVWMPKYEIKPI